MINPAQRIYKARWSVGVEIAEPGKPASTGEFPRESECTFGTGRNVHFPLHDPDAEPYHFALHAKDGVLVATELQGKLEPGAGWVSEGKRHVFAGNPGPARLTVGSTRIVAWLQVKERPSLPRTSDPLEAATLYNEPVPEALREVLDDPNARTLFFDRGSRSSTPPSRAPAPLSSAPSSRPSRTPPPVSYTATRHEERKEGSAKKPTANNTMANKTTNGATASVRRYDSTVEWFKTGGLLGLVLVVGLVLLSAVILREVRSLKAGVRCVSGQSR